MRAVAKNDSRAVQYTYVLTYNILLFIIFSGDGMARGINGGGDRRSYILAVASMTCRSTPLPSCHRILSRFIGVFSVYTF